MSDELQTDSGNVDDESQRIRDLALRPDSKKPVEIRDGEWRKARIDAGHMIIIRSHFKSIYLFPLALVSLVCGVAVSMATGPESANSGWTHFWGLLWAFCFMFYMNVFIFEWNRAWTVVLMISLFSLVCIGVAINSESYPVWEKLYNAMAGLRLGLSQQTYFFFSIFFFLCAMVSWVKTRLNYVVIEHNEMQLYRNAFFGDRERISMLNPRIEVKVLDMIEYFHPFYRSGTVVIHAPSKTIILENVLNIRKIERVTDRLGSTLSVRVEQ